MASQELELQISPEVAKVGQHETLEVVMKNTAGDGLLVTDGRTIIKAVEKTYGRLEDLTTLDKSSYISALNEVKLNNERYEEQLNKKLKEINTLKDSFNTDVDTEVQKYVNSIRESLDSLKSELQNNVESGIISKIDSKIESLKSEIQTTVKDNVNRNSGVIILEAGDSPSTSNIPLGRVAFLIRT